MPGLPLPTARAVRRTRHANMAAALACAILLRAPEANSEARRHVSELVLSDPRLPDDAALLAQIEAAVDFRVRAEFTRQLDAEYPGDLLEDAQTPQEALRQGALGLDALFAVGDDLFEYAFRPGQGLGNDLAGFDLAGHGPMPNMRRVHAGDFGGPDAFSCAGCHFKGGPDGSGTNTQNAFFRGDGDSTKSADERNPPHVLGLGPVAALAREMTAELQATRDDALADARERREPVRRRLRTKGVAFGHITALPDGMADVSEVEGVDPDLVVRPFGWKGHQASLRGIVEESFRVHMGLVSANIQERVRDGLLSPDLYGDGEWSDIDKDGTIIEIDDGMVTTMVVYLAQLQVPLVQPPQAPLLLDAFAQGRGLFERVGCASCHRPVMVLEDPLLVTRPDQPRFMDDEPVVVDVARDGVHPKPAARTLLEEAFEVELFSDLKRHDMGPALRTPTIQRGVPPTVFLTRSLWGLAETAPYLHDGRAPTVHDAIVLHGGEARDARDAYRELTSEEQGALRVFLLALSRQPELFVP